MFQTEPVHFMQSLANEWLTGFMVLVSSMGHIEVAVGVVSIITLGVNLRKGFLLTQMVLWADLWSSLLKDVFALPRPSDVDCTVELLGKDRTNHSPFTGRGAAGFFQLLDPEVIEYYRSQPEWSFGLPSAHVSRTTTLWSGMSLLFQRTAVRLLAVVMVSLMLLSRMYLGRHFLADVLGGLVVGGTIVVVTYPLFIRPTSRGWLLDVVRLRLAADARTSTLLVCLLLMPLATLMLTPLVDPGDAGRLFGLGVAFLLIARRGLPDDTGTFAKRVGRVLLGGALYMVANFLVGQLIDLLPVDNDAMWIEFLEASVPTFVFLWATVTLGLATGLYREPAAVRTVAA